MENETSLPTTAASSEIAGLANHPQQGVAPAVMNNYGNAPQIGTVQGDINIQNGINFDDPRMQAKMVEMFKGCIPQLIDEYVKAQAANNVPQTVAAPEASSSTSESAVTPAETPAEPTTNTEPAPEATVESHPTPRRTQSYRPLVVSYAFEWSRLSTEKYNLFVLENEEYDHGVFSISKNCAITRYTSQEDMERFRYLDANAIRELCEMPCIFAKRNAFYNHTEDNHPAVVGRLEKIMNQGETIKFVFKGFQAISQQLLNDNLGALGIARAALRNEFDEEHWSIKPGNLQTILTNLGVIIR